MPILLQAEITHAFVDFPVAVTHLRTKNAVTEPLFKA